MVNVVALFLLILSVIPVYIAQRITGGEAAGAPLVVDGRRLGEAGPGAVTARGGTTGSTTGVAFQLVRPGAAGRESGRSTGSPWTRWRSTISRTSAGDTAAYQMPSG